MALIGLPSGCQRFLDPPPPPPHQGAVVHVVCPQVLVPLVESQSLSWQSRQQARVRVTANENPSAQSQADVWLVPPPDLPRLAEAGLLQAVPESITRRGEPFDWSGLLPTYREQLLVWDRKPFALPLLGESQVCLHRADLFTAPEYQKKFRTWYAARTRKPGEPPRELRPPSSWEEYVLFAEFFRDHHPSGKPGPSLPPLPEDSAALDRLFYTVASSCARRAIRQDEPAGADHLLEVFSFQYDQKTGAPRIATAGFVAALDLLVRMQACRPQGRHPRPEQAFVDGQAILAVTDLSWLIPIQKRGSLLRDRVGITGVPGAERFFTARGEARGLTGGVNRVPYLGSAGWFGVVPTAAANASAAWGLLAELAGSARSSQILLEPRWGGGPIRTEQVMRERWDLFDLDGKQTQGLREAVTGSVSQHGLKNPTFCLRTPDQASHRAALDAGLRRALLEKEDPAKVLAEVSRKWTALDEARGLDRHRREYRISLGLLGN